MIRFATSALALMPSLLFTTSLRAQQDGIPQGLQPAILNKISHEDGLALGNGVSLDRLSPAYDSPFTIVNRVANKIPNPATSIRMHLVSNSKALASVTGTNVEAKARVLFARAEAKHQGARDFSISEDAFQLVIVGESKYGDNQLGAVELKPDAAALIEKGEMQRFSQVYGTHYVLREHRIARIALTISVDRWSEQSRKQTRSAFKTGASIPLFGGELAVSIQRDLKDAAGRGALHVDVTTIGGSGLEAYGDLVKTMLAGGGDLQAAVGQSISAVLNGFNWDNSGVGSVTVVPYTGFGWDPGEQPLWNHLFEERLQECAARYYAGREVLRNIREFAIPNADEALKMKLNRSAAEYDAYLVHLAHLQKAILAKDEKAVQQEFPKEPEIDSETARELLGGFSTLESRLLQLEREVQVSLADKLVFDTITVVIYSNAATQENPTFRFLRTCLENQFPLRARRLDIKLVMAM